MEITCLHCHQTWQLTSGQFHVTRLRFVFGSHAQIFVCPNCQTANIISEHTFKTSDPQRPVMAENDPRKSSHHHPRRADNDPAPSPINPIPMPEPAARELHAIVLEHRLPLRRKHHRAAEIMGTLRKNEHVIVLDTWSNRGDTWLQLGPERWVQVEQDGETLINLLDESI